MFWLSFTDTSLIGAGKFVGLANYTRALGDNNFWRALKFTALYTVFLTPVLMVLGFLLALLTASNQPMPKARARHHFSARRHRAWQFKLAVGVDV